MKAKLREFFKYDLPLWFDKVKSDPKKLMIAVGLVMFLVGVGIGKANAEVTMRVVEILAKGEVMAYFLTSSPVSETPPIKGANGESIPLKPERNA